MPEPIEIEALLRESMDDGAPPTLTPEFTERVTARVRPRRLSARARRTLGWYTVGGLGASVVLMWSQGLGWGVIAGSLAVTAAIGVILRRRLG